MSLNSLLNNWYSIVSPVRNDIVFKDRNKEYGAYKLRSNHNRIVAISLFITAFSFVILISLPKIINWLNNSTEDVEIPVEITNVDLLAPPPLDESEPPPPPPPPPPPVMETVKFTPPVVTDEEVTEDPPPVQTEETPQISTTTQEGDGSDEIIIPDDAGNGVVETKAEEIFTFVEQQPSFEGGEGEMMKFIQKHIQYPQMEKEAGVSGTCYITFVVEKDGRISNVNLLRGVSGGPGCDKEAIRVVKMMPSWKPGKQNGRDVRVQFNLPIKFSLK